MYVQLSEILLTSYGIHTALVQWMVVNKTYFTCIYSKNHSKVYISEADKLLRAQLIAWGRENFL